MTKFKIGIMGGGGIVGAHNSGYEIIKDICEVVAVAEPDVARHATLKQWFGENLKLVADYHDLLQMKEIQAVDICLPHALHRPATIAAAEAGKHVLVEKVLARNIWECDQMIQACEKHRVSLHVCHDRHLDSNWRKLKEIIDSGVLGEIFFLKLDHNQNVPLPAGHWIANIDEVGGGAVMSCLTHQLDGLLWYGGEVEAVNCMTKIIPERMEGEFLGLMSAKMRSGALAQLSINWWTRSNSWPALFGNGLWYEMVQVCGTQGEAYYMSGRGTFVKLHEKNNPSAIEKYGEKVLTEFVETSNVPGDGHQNLVAGWVKGLIGMPAPEIPDGRTARGAVELAEAAYMAVESRHEVNLPIQPKPWVNRSNPEMVGRQFACTAPKSVGDKATRPTH